MGRCRCTGCHRRCHDGAYDLRDPELMDEVQITALVACVLGGFQTFHGPVIGAYIMGIVRNLCCFMSPPSGVDRFYTFLS